MTKETIWQLRCDEYDSAFANITQITIRFPQAPHSYLLAADAYQTMMRDYRVRIYEAEFDSVIDLTIAKAKQALQKERTALNYFMLGTAQGYLGIHEFYLGNLLRGVSTAFGAIKTMKAAIHADEAFADPLFALAIYDFGQYKALGWGLGFFKRKREKALQQLQEVQRHGSYAVYHAMYSQQRIYFDGGEFEKALAINDRLYQTFFKNPSCLYHRALLLDKTGRYAQTAEIWQELIDRINAFVAPSNGFLGECYYHLAVNAWEQGNLREAISKIKLAQGYLIKFDEKRELNGPYFKNKDLKKWTKNKHKKWQVQKHK
ncbi:MAG: tetratricopeptide repeat protein [bacterium]